MSNEAASALRGFIRPLVPSLEAFVDGKVDPEDFERTFFALWPSLGIPPSDEVDRVTERFFFRVDDHVGDPRLREPGDIDTETLREFAADLLREAGVR